MKKLVDEKLIVTFAQIRKYLEIPEKEGWLELVLSITDDLVNSEKEYFIEGSRLCKKTINSKE